MLSAEEDKDELGGGGWWQPGGWELSWEGRGDLLAFKIKINLRLKLRTNVTPLNEYVLLIQGITKPKKQGITSSTSTRARILPRLRLKREGG